MYPESTGNWKKARNFFPQVKRLRHFAVQACINSLLEMDEDFPQITDNKWDSRSRSWHAPARVGMRLTSPFEACWRAECYVS